MRTTVHTLSTRLRRAHDQERGATAIEYALMSSLIALVIIGGVTALGTTVMGLFVSVTDNWP